MTDKEAIEILKRIDIKFFLCGMNEQSNYIVDEADKVNNAIETVLNLLENQKAEIEKKDKIIDLMLEEMVNNHCSIRDIVEEEICDDRCIENNNWTCFKHIEQYFEKKAEEEK